MQLVKEINKLKDQCNSEQLKAQELREDLLKQSQKINELMIMNKDGITAQTSQVNLVSVCVELIINLVLIQIFFINR